VAFCYYNVIEKRVYWVKIARRQGRILVAMEE